MASCSSLTSSLSSNIPSIPQFEEEVHQTLLNMSVTTTTPCAHQISFSRILDQLPFLVQERDKTLMQEVVSRSEETVMPLFQRHHPIVSKCACGNEVTGFQLVIPDHLTAQADVPRPELETEATNPHETVAYQRAVLYVRQINELLRPTRPEALHEALQSLQYCLAQPHASVAEPSTREDHLLDDAAIAAALENSTSEETTSLVHSENDDAAIAAALTGEIPTNDEAAYLETDEVLYPVGEAPFTNAETALINAIATPLLDVENGEALPLEVRDVQLRLAGTMAMSCMALIVTMGLAGLLILMANSTASYEADGNFTR